MPLTTPTQDLWIGLLLISAFIGVVWLFIRDEWQSLYEEWKQERKTEKSDYNL